MRPLFLESDVDESALWSIDDPDWHPKEAYAEAFSEDSYRSFVLEPHHWQVVCRSERGHVMTVCRNLADVFQWIYDHREESSDGVTEILKVSGEMPV